MNKNQKFNLLKNSDNQSLKLFQNAKIVCPEKDEPFDGEVLISNGLIEEVAEKIDISNHQNVEIIDCKGKILTTGLIDSQVHVGEPGGKYKETILNTTKSAVAGGVTTINIMPDVQPVIDNTAMVHFMKGRVDHKTYCNVSISGSVTKNLDGAELSEIGLLKKSGVSYISDCANYIADSQVFKRACEYASNFDVTIAQQPKDIYLSKNAILNESDISTKLGIKASPDYSETIGLFRDLQIAINSDVKYHALNLSAKGSIDLISQYKTENISASVTSAHLYFDESEAENYRTFAKIDPPLRSAEDNQAIIKGLKSGDIDFITTNTSPCSVDQKRISMQSAEFGAVGLETFFAATYTKLSQNGFNLNQIMKLISLNPAKFLGLNSRGKIKKGCIADLIIVDINSKWKVIPEDFASKSVNSPFDGVELTGLINKTYSNGELVYEK